MPQITNIFVNLPVKDLNTSKAFFSALGFPFNQQFTNENAACLIINPNIYAMLLTEEFYKTFTSRQIIDAEKSIEVINALSVNSRKEVDELADKALECGGSAINPPADHGFMYSRSFQDPDHHYWEVFWMDPNHLQTQ